MAWIDSYGPHRLQWCGPWGGAVIGTATDVTDATGAVIGIGTATDVTDATGAVIGLGTATDVTDATGAVIGTATSASSGSDWRSAHYVLRRIGGSPPAI